MLDILQWGRSRAEMTTTFNIKFYQSVFTVVASQSNIRYSSAVIGVSGGDVSLSGFFGYAGDVYGKHYEDDFYWISIGV